MVNLRELFPVGIWSSTDNQNRWTLDLNESPAMDKHLYIKLILR